MIDTDPIVDVKKLTVDFSTGGGKTVRAVAGVDLSLEKGETLALLRKARETERRAQDTTCGLRRTTRPTIEASVRRGAEAFGPSC